MRIMLAACLGLCLLAARSAVADEVLFEPQADAVVGINSALEGWRAGRQGDAWWPWAVTAWDQDADGKPDLLLTTHSGGGSILLRQGPDLSFTDVTASLGLKPTQLPHQMRPVVLDVDGDGKTDLVPSIEGTLPLIWNRGGKLEVGPNISELRSRHGELVDLNGDGKLDWLQFTRDYGKTTRTQFLNTGKTLVRSSTRLTIPEDLPATVRARLEALEKEDPKITAKYPAGGANRYCGPVFDRRDINGDGREDCVCQYFGSYGAPSRTFGIYLLRDADGNLQDITENCGIPGHLTPLFPLRDLTGDGRIDVLAAFGKEAGLYVQQPDQTFVLQSNKELSAILAPTTGSYLYGVRYVDFDKDGDDDLLLTQYRLGVLEIYENRGEGNFVRALRAGHWDAEGFDVADLDGDGLPDLVTGGPPPGGSWHGGDRHNDNQVTVWLNRTKVPESVKARKTDQQVAETPDNKVASAADNPSTTTNRNSGTPKGSRARRLRVRIPGVYEGVIEVLEELPPEKSNEASQKPKPSTPEKQDVPPKQPSPQPAISSSAPIAGGSVRHPLESVNPASPAVRTYLGWVDQSIRQSQYGYSRFHAALAYKLTGNAKYADLAVKGLTVQGAKDSAAAGKAPGVSHDSYLHVGNQIQDIVFVLVWCGDRLTPEQRADLEDYCRQVIFNVWNPTKATYYGKPFPWNGWSIDNPGNNYFYSFVNATVCWALYSQDKQWLDFLRTVKLPRLVAQMQALPEGGSREGTGYGTSHATLFGIYALWQLNTGEDLASQSTHCRNSLEYWTHAICPGGKYFSPLGDQARESTAPMYDYQRNLLLRAASLYPDTPETKHARFALLGYPKMAHGFNYVNELWTSPTTAEEPPELSYAAKGVGHYFARSSWKADATALTFQAGRIYESHMAQSQGHFDLWGASGWLASTNNVRSKSGINQTTEWQNLVRLNDSAGKGVPQDRSVVVVADVIDDGSTWRGEVELGPVYKGTGLAWKRSLTYERPHKLTVNDVCTVPAGYSATWQLSTSAQPVINGNVATAGKLRATVLKPEKPVIEAKDWKALTKEANSGWRLEVTGGSEFLVVLEVLR